MEAGWGFIDLYHVPRICPLATTPKYNKWVMCHEFMTRLIITVGVLSVVSPILDFPPVRDFLLLDPIFTGTRQATSKRLFLLFGSEKEGDGRCLGKELHGFGTFSYVLE